MSNIDFYYARTGNSLRAAIALELANPDFQKHELSLPDKQHKEEWFLKINPAGVVPVLVDKSGTKPMVLTQSGAILDFLISRHRPDLWPQTDSERALCMAVVMSAVSDVAVQNGLARYLGFIPEASDFVLERLLKAILSTFAAVNNHPFLCGEAITIADYAHLPVIYMRELFLTKDSRFKHIMAWLERMKTDPAARRAIAYAGSQITE